MDAPKETTALFSVYVRDRDGERLPRSAVGTSNAQIADDAIAGLLNRPDFAGEPVTLVALYRGNVYFIHEFTQDPEADLLGLELLGDAACSDWLRYPSLH